MFGGRLEGPDVIGFEYGWYRLLCRERLCGTGEGLVPFAVVPLDVESRVDWDKGDGVPDEVCCDVEL